MQAVAPHATPICQRTTQLIAAKKNGADYSARLVERLSPIANLY